ncbi:hypothetical protein FRC05_003667 [Tulasnella sp. 425]|nr:hypothetical protein FRC05_003667 [Tulasnella sp. 425]
MEKYTTWIQRSKDMPLNISIKDKSFARSFSQNVEAIMELIGPHMERWRSLQVEQAALEDIRLLLAHLKNHSLPMLGRLWLEERYRGFRDLDGRNRSPKWESSELFAFKTPRLQNLELVGIVADFDSPLHHNLYTLYLEDEYFYLLEPQAAKDIIYRLLQQSPRLKQLQIHKCQSNAIIEHQNPPLHPPIIGESLNHSSLVDLTLNLARGVCDTIIPSVKLLAFRSFYSGRKSVVTISSWHLPLLAQTSAFPSLRRIDLSGHPNDPLYSIHLPAVLATLESLEELGMVQFDMTQVANALPTLGYSCPQLREVTIYQCTGVDLDQVRSLVETRIRADGMSELHKIRIFGGIDDAFPELKDKAKWVREHVEHFILLTEEDWNEWFVLDMPDLWSQIHFHLLELRLSIEKYATWIQRSKDVPLDISIKGEPVKTSGAQNVEAIMTLIAPHMERWRSLQVEQVVSEDIRLLLAYLKSHNLPQLKHLRLKEWDNGLRDLGGRARSPEWESPGLFAFHTPQLQNLELVGIVADFDSPLYHNLYTLYLEDEHFHPLEPEAAKDIIHRLLQQSPHLKQLLIKDPRVRVTTVQRNPPPRSPIIEKPLKHSSLVDLTLNLREAVHDAILPSLKLPALRSLYSRRKSAITISSWHLPLLARTSPFPSLKRIDLSGLPNDLQYNIYLPAVLATLESLEELGLEQFDMSQVANALLTLGRSCPQLRELMIYQCTGVDLDQVRSLVDTRIRADGISELRKIRIFGGVDDAFPGLKDNEKWIRARVEHFVLFTEADWNEYV